MGTPIPLESLLLALDCTVPKGVVGGVRLGGRLTFYFVTPRPSSLPLDKGVELSKVVTTAIASDAPPQQRMRA